jgi:hypothetical protein
VLGRPQHPPRPGLADFAAQNTKWLRIYRLPAYAPEFNPPKASGADPGARLPVCFRQEGLLSPG